jgi:hypothetical protein
MSAGPPFPPDLPIQRLLAGVSAHLDRLAAMVHDVEHALAEDRGGGHAAPQSVARLQNLDFLRQQTEDLAMLMLWLSQRQGQDRLLGVEAVRLSKRLKLERTRALLFGDAARVSGPGHDIGAGEVDLF